MRTWIAPCSVTAASFVAICAYVGCATTATDGAAKSGPAVPESPWIDPATATQARLPGDRSSTALPLNTDSRVPAGYRLVFSDEFNGKAVDKDKWFFRYIYENAKLDHLNDEIGRRVDSAVSISKGALTLTASRRDDGKWDTGLCRSKFTLKYGYLESAVKFPEARGAWPSFWLNSGVENPDGTFSKLSWPPEIDIFELVNNGREGPTAISSFVHGKKAIGGDSFTRLDKWGNYRPGYSLADGRWHVIGCLWTPTDTTTFVDGVKIVTHKYRWVYEDGTDAAPAHILLDMAVGGHWPGNPTTKDPFTLQFDYIRVYQLPGQGEATTVPAERH